MNDETGIGGASEEELRKQAVASLNRKRAFKQTAFAYVVVNLLLIGIWAVTGADYFWPVWVIGGWGIGLAFQAWGAYGQRRGISEDEVAREMQRLKN